MKRWNGWGDTSVHYPMPALALHLLEQQIGKGMSLPDASFDAALARVPPSRVTGANMDALPITTDATERLLHARGQSLPDWVALRSGSLGAFPDAVAHPRSDEQVRALLRYAREHDATVIPYGGGTSVVGHITPLPDAPPTLTLDLSGLDRLLDMDATSRLATFQAGITGPELETQLRVRGYTLGHYPQSWEYSTLGGWIAARSSGQQSYYYGRIENLFAGGHVETPLGSLDLPPLPASAAGLDVRQLVLGSEGRIGVITRAVLRVRPLPQVDKFYAAFFRDWASGVSTVRDMAQSGVGVSMLRLSDADETETTLLLAGQQALVAFARRGLELGHYGRDRCLLIFSVTGDQRETDCARGRAEANIRAARGLPVPFLIGEMWRKTRFRTPYLRNTLWEHGYALDTLETALPWARVLDAARDLKDALQHALEDDGEAVWVMAHLSHVYPDGASIYVTYAYRRAADPQTTLARWVKLKTAASHIIVALRGTISHQHGVGIDHAPYLIAEKGALGVLAIEQARRAFDPYDMMNPGKLICGI